MKTLLTFATLIFALNVAGFSQSQTPPTPRKKMTTEERERMIQNSAQRQTDRMKEQFTLSAEQEKTIHETNLKYAQMRVNASDSASYSGSDVRTLLNELEEKREAEILATLTEAQQNQYHQNKQEQQVRREEMRKRVQERRQQSKLDSTETARPEPQKPSKSKK